jgi:hypothetical protein
LILIQRLVQLIPVLGGVAGGGSRTERSAELFAEVHAQYFRQIVFGIDGFNGYVVTLLLLVGILILFGC